MAGVALCCALPALAFLLTAQAQAQGAMAGVDLQSPAMTEAEMTPVEVAEMLAAAAPGSPADLSRRMLNGLDLRGFDFAGANLRAARLNGADLRGAVLDGAELGQAWLLGADLTGASLRGAQLFQAQFGRAVLREADLSGARAVADFSRADLTEAVLVGADFAPDMKNQSMGLTRGVLRNVRADGADFTDAHLMQADMEFASLRGARLVGADLTLAALGGADLTGADVTGAVFLAADVASTRLIELRGADRLMLETARNLRRAFRR